MSQVFSPPPYLIDAHVHLHECFDEAGFFRAADENFRIAGSSLELDSAPAGVLMLTESSGTDRFSDLRRRARNREPSELLIEETGEDLSLLVATPAHRPLLVVAGRQVVTSENLEVLALGCTLEIPDGATLEATLDRVRESGSIPVIPWGFGKWRSRRRRALLEVLQQQAPGSVYLGDNGGRTALLPRSSLIRNGGSRGFWNLPGSDPLPFPEEVDRVGSFGFLVERALDPTRPATDLLRLLAESDRSLTTYGTGLGALAFCRNQVAMQARKRIRGERP